MNAFTQALTPLVAATFFSVSVPVTNPPAESWGTHAARMMQFRRPGEGVLLPRMPQMQGAAISSELATLAGEIGGSIRGKVSRGLELAENIRSIEREDADYALAARFALAWIDGLAIGDLLPSRIYGGSDNEIGLVWEHGENYVDLAIYGDGTVAGYARGAGNIESFIDEPVHFSEIPDEFLSIIMTV